MSAPLDPQAALRLYHLAYIELGVQSFDEAVEVARRYVAGLFEITDADRQRAPQTCRELRKLREEASAG